MTIDSTITYCPFLMLTNRTTVGPWELVPWPGNETLWKNQVFEHRVEQLFGHLRGPDGSPIEQMTLIVSADGGANGRIPDEKQRKALQAALDFAVLHQPGSGIAGPPPFTSDNTEIHLWPINEECGNAAFDTGLLIKTVHGGWRLDDPNWSVPCPPEVPRPTQTLIDKDIASAIYDVATTDYQSDSERKLRNRIVSSLRWWSRSRRNSTSVSPHDRVVITKIALELLISGEDGKYDKDKIRSLFETLSANAMLSRFSHTLLWNPDEEDHRTWDFKKEKNVPVSDLQHWFLSFSEVRNQIAHDGSDEVSLNYVADGSRYTGFMLDIAHLVFCEAVTILLERLGFQNLWLQPLDRASAAFAQKRLIPIDADTE